jgi:hypothetical protein
MSYFAFITEWDCRDSAPTICKTELVFIRFGQSRVIDLAFGVESGLV